MSVSEISTPPVPTGAIGPRYAVEIIRDVRIPTNDPTATLSGDLFLPVGAGAVPALVTLLPYRKDAGAGIQGEAGLRWFAARGYASMLVDFQGTGSSDGMQRPPFDPTEADDGVAAVDWAAEQAWCDGNVGMWGHSYGAIMSMRTAVRRPPQLKAIAPVMGMIDIERDFVHPDGCAGCMGSLATWGTQTLFNQLLPPLDGHGTGAEQLRWRNRLHQMRPWLLDLFQHGPGDPVWRTRAVDASAISIPSLCVAGWRDLFCDGSIRAFEQIAAPKKLLVGPWMHTAPEVSQFTRVDLPALLLRWWDHWLRDVDSGLMDEPAVTLYVQGDTPGWRGFTSWPPSETDLRLETAEDTDLRPAAHRVQQMPTGSPDVIAEHEPDHTVGILSGMAGIPTGGIGLPLDQHDDDMRGLACTGDPLVDGMVVVGRPTVAVRLGEGSTLDRLVVRLADVDPQGRSTLITMGVAALPSATAAGAHEMTLAPTCYRVPAGHRLRVVLGDADFPRLWPALPGDHHRSVLRLADIHLALPVMSDAHGAVVSLPVPEDAPPPGAAVLALHQQPRWVITRDILNDGIDVTLGTSLTSLTPNHEHLLEVHQETSAHVTRAAPAAALVRGRSTGTARMATGETITIRVELRLTRTTVDASGHIDIDGDTVFSRQWRDLTR